MTNSCGVVLRVWGTQNTVECLVLRGEGLEPRGRERVLLVGVSTHGYSANPGGRGQSGGQRGWISLERGCPGSGVGCELYWHVEMHICTVWWGSSGGLVGVWWGSGLCGLELRIEGQAGRGSVQVESRGGQKYLLEIV